MGCIFFDPIGIAPKVMYSLNNGLNNTLSAHMNSFKNIHISLHRNAYCANTIFVIILLSD